MMLSWKKTTAGNIPEGAIPCGGRYDTGEILYPARVYHIDGMHIGKVGNKEHKQAHIPWGGKELLFNEFEVLVMENPQIDKKHISNFRYMVTNKYIPYQKIPDAPGKTFEEIRELGKQYFPFSEYSFELALAVYDWTTADFARIQFLNLFTYVGISDHIFDTNSIANAIWTSNWPPHTPADIYYMNSFMMKPAHSLEEVKTQLDSKLNLLCENNLSENLILSTAISLLPIVNCDSIKELYSGQVDIGNLKTHHFATFFMELPANNDRSLPPLEMNLDDALQGFLSVGSNITLKTFMSFTDSYSDAEKYSNGIMVTVIPPKDAMFWEKMAYITPLSDDPEKNEYLFMPNTKFRIDSIKKESNLTKILLELL